LFEAKKAKRSKKSQCKMEKQPSRWRATTSVQMAGLFP
jgi:hypothetical protein